jgi:mannonate dehydratase
MPVEELPMRVGLGQFMEPNEERLRYVKQLGVEDVLLNMYQYDPDYPHMPTSDANPLDGDAEWSEENLRALREHVESHGLRLTVIENVPISFYDDVMLGREDREDQIEHMKATIRNLGAAGIPYFGYHWSPTGVWRTGEVTVRGGAAATSFSIEDADPELVYGREFSEEELWKNYEYFLEELLPVAEEAGVKLCLHPNDPPVDEPLGGVPMLFRDFESFKRAMEIVPSDHHGLDLCLGCWSEMGADLEEAIQYFGEREEIFYVHFRDVEGTVPKFEETWIDEGNYDALEIMHLLADVGFSGIMIPDHMPHLEGDTDWDHRGRAYTAGYMKGLLECVSD